MKAFPKYIAEIQGLGKGSGVPFPDIFYSNFKEEFQYYFPSDEHSADACTDVSFCTPSRCLLGHNEDGDVFNNVENILLKATFGNHTFIAFT